MSGIIITLSITEHEDQPLALTMSNLGFKKRRYAKWMQKSFLNMGRIHSTSTHIQLSLK